MANSDPAAQASNEWYPLVTAARELADALKELKSLYDPKVDPHNIESGMGGPGWFCLDRKVQPAFLALAAQYSLNPPGGNTWQVQKHWSPTEEVAVIALRHALQVIGDAAGIVMRTAGKHTPKCPKGGVMWGELGAGRLDLSTGAKHWLVRRPRKLAEVDEKTVAILSTQADALEMRFVNEIPSQPVAGTGKATAARVLLGVLAGLLAGVAFEFCVLKIWPWNWLSQHPNRLTLHAGFLSFCFVGSFLIFAPSAWRKLVFCVLLFPILLLVFAYLGH